MKRKFQNDKRSKRIMSELNYVKLEPMPINFCKVKRLMHCR